MAFPIRTSALSLVALIVCWTVALIYFIIGFRIFAHRNGNRIHPEKSILRTNSSNVSTTMRRKTSNLLGGLSFFAFVGLIFGGFFASFDWRLLPLSACTAASRFQVILYGLFYYLMYLFLAIKSRITRAMHSETKFEALVKYTTHYVPFIGPVFAFWTTSQIIEQGSDAGTCVIQITPYASLTMALLNIVMSACYLYLFIKPLMEVIAIRERISGIVETEVDTHDAESSKIDDPLYAAVRSNVALCTAALMTSIIALTYITVVNFGSDPKLMKYTQLAALSDAAGTFTLFLSSARKLWL